MTFDRKFLLCAFAYAILGMSVGVIMGITENHRELVAHAHILLVGFVVSFIYALVHKLWLTNVRRGIAQVQFYLHQIAALVMFIGLLLLYGGVSPPSTVGPVVGLASIGVLLAAVLMAYMIVTNKSARA